MMLPMTFSDSELPLNVSVHVHESDRIKLVFIRIVDPETGQAVRCDLDVYLVDQPVACFLFRDLPDEALLARMVSAVQDILVSPGLHAKEGRPIEDFAETADPRPRRIQLSDELVEVNGCIKGVKDLQRVISVNNDFLRAREFSSVSSTNYDLLLRKTRMLVQNRLYQERLSLKTG